MNLYDCECGCGKQFKQNKSGRKKRFFDSSCRKRYQRCTEKRDDPKPLRKTEKRDNPKPLRKTEKRDNGFDEYVLAGKRPMYCIESGQMIIEDWDWSNYTREMQTSGIIKDQTTYIQ